MKTTIELPDDLLIAAKAVAARRRTTLRAMIEHALRHEIQESSENSDNAPYTIDSDGLPLLRKDSDSSRKVTSEQVYQLMEDLGI